jgi:hypothetical protein
MESRDYDLWRGRKDAEYESLIAGKACGDCGMCAKPGGEFENAEGIGWCLEDEDFVFIGESVDDKGCPFFEG